MSRVHAYCCCSCGERANAGLAGARPRSAWEVSALLLSCKWLYDSHRRLARLEVCEDDEGRVNVKASNISVVSVDLSKVSAKKLVICGHEISSNILHFSRDRDAGTLWLEQVTDDGLTGWKVTLPVFLYLDNLHTLLRQAVDSYVETFQQPHGRAQAILSANGHIDIVIPSLNHSLELSAALRIAHSLRTFHLLDARISSASEAENDRACGGNMVVIGCADSSFVNGLLVSSQSDWSYKGGAWVLDDKRFDRPSSGGSARWCAGVC